MQGVNVVPLGSLVGNDVGDSPPEASATLIRVAVLTIY
jgi:hypothetical protein